MARMVQQIILLSFLFASVFAAPSFTSVSVTGANGFQIVYNETISAPHVNSNNGKDQYTVKIDDSAETIVSISISSNTVSFVTTSTITAEKVVKVQLHFQWQ